MSILILSDIHGNQTALQSVINKTKEINNISGCILLGDLIDYGMHSNEVIEMLQNLSYPILCNIRGNHEQAVLTEDYTRFSSDRGKECAKYTRSILSPDTWTYLEKTMLNTGMSEFEVKGKKCLAVHGSLKDIYWKSIQPGQDLETYKKYDFVFSGHSHLPHFFEVFYDADAPKYRNKKKTVFINPGSVGQPRNLNKMAQFCVLDTESEKVSMEKVIYDIKKEQEAFNCYVDDFYKTRLECGV